MRLSANQREMIKLLTWLSECHGRSRIPERWYYRGPADLLLREGSWFTPKAGALCRENALPQACFRNSALYAISHGLRYIEGYALNIIPVHHAWCADQAGKVYETTWDRIGSAYFGVQFRPAVVINGSALFNPKQARLYRRKLEK
jgi:hypothetical protein